MRGLGTAYHNNGGSKLTHKAAGRLPDPGLLLTAGGPPRHYEKTKQDCRLEFDMILSFSIATLPGIWDILLTSNIKNIIQILDKHFAAGS